MGLSATLGLLFTSCAGPSEQRPPAPTTAAVSPPEAPTTAQKPFGQLKKGLLAADIVKLVGPAETLIPSTVQGVKSEIWIYKHFHPGTTKSVATDMQEIPYVDPVSGVMKMIKEPIYRSEVTRVVETTELLLIEGRLIEWKQRRESVRGYY